jgi:hypothetical protein
VDKTKFVQIARDPFARGDVVRGTVKVQHGETCAWCGQPGRAYKSGGQRLFVYGWWDDAKPKPAFAVGLYCSVDCFRAHYG